MPVYRRTVVECLGTTWIWDQVDELDAGLGHGQQFAGVADAVLVAVAPDPELAPAGVIGIKNIVVVRVEDETRPSRSEMSDVPSFVRPQCKRQLARLIDDPVRSGRAISTEIDRQEAIIRADPSGFLSRTPSPSQSKPTEEVTGIPI